MPTMDLNEYINSSQATMSTVPSGSPTQKIATVDRTIGRQMQSDAAAAGELARSALREADVKTSLDVNAALLEVQANQEFAGTLSKLKSDAEANAQRQASLYDRIETNTVRMSEIEQDNAGSYNPLKLIVNGIELKTVKEENQALLRESVELSNLQRARANTVTNTFTSHTAAVIVPAVNRLKLEAAQDLREINFDGKVAAVAEIRKGLGEWAQDAGRSIDLGLKLTAEQRAQQDQAFQSKMQKIQLEGAQLALAEAKVGNVTYMSGAADTFLAVQGVPDNEQNRASALAYIKNVAAKNPKLYSTYTILGAEIAKAKAAGKPLNRATLLDSVKELPIELSAPILEQAGDRETVNAVGAAFDKKQFAIQKAVTDKYIADNKLGMKPLTAAQNKAINDTVSRQMSRYTPKQLMGDEASQLKMQVPAQGSFGALAEGTTLYATSQMTQFMQQLSPRQKAVVQSPVFKNVVEKPVVADGDKAPVYKAFDLMKAAQDSNSLSVRESAELVAKLYRERDVQAKVATSSAAEGLVRNGFDISADSLMVKMGRREDSGKLVQFLQTGGIFGVGVGRPGGIGSQNVLDSLSGDVDLASAESLMLYFNRRLKAQSQ